jgi:WD40 repeat protein
MIGAFAGRLRRHRTTATARRTRWMIAALFALAPQSMAAPLQAEKRNEQGAIIKIADTASNEIQPKVLHGHSAAVQTVTFSDDGKYVASASYDKTIKIWDVRTGAEIKTLSGHTGWLGSVCFSPDGRLLASGSQDLSVKIWDAATGHEIKTLRGFRDTVWSVAFSPEGRKLVAGSRDGTIKLWESGTWRDIMTLPEGGAYARDPADSVGSARTIALSPDGYMLAKGSWNSQITLFDLRSGKQGRTLAGHTAAVYSLAFSHDGRMLVSAGLDKTIKLWDPATGVLIATLTGHTGGVNSVAVSPDSRYLASASDDGMIKLWDARTHREIRSLPAYDGGTRSVAFSPDGHFLVSGGQDKTVKLWDISDAAIFAAAPAPLSPVVNRPAPQTPAPAGRRVALVIGNRDYGAATLANPVFDADLVSAALRGVGFEVLEVTNADFKAMDAALNQFSAMADQASVALFYFAGHGFALNDGVRPRNYLMSTSADLHATDELILSHDGLPLDTVISRISKRAQVTIAFIDACRNDPFHRGVGDRGFDRIVTSNHRQLFVGMSTQVGKTAIDGEAGKGSPFAQAFAEVIATPGLRIDDAFRDLRDRVAARTSGSQRPEILEDDLDRGSLILTGQ